jgi:hypothetical protein
MPHPLDNLYRGRPIFVLSTGTSLRGFDFRRLDGHLTIGVNRIVEYYHPSIMFFVDVTAKATHARALRGYRGIVIAGPGAAPHDTDATVFEINPDNRAPSQQPTPFDEALRMWASERHVVGRSFNECLYGLGAGCQALHAAILLGASPIFLLGYDFYEDRGSHFDDIDASRNRQDLYRHVSACIDDLAREPWLPAVYNCNPASKLTCFPFMSLDVALHHAVLAHARE